MTDLSKETVKRIEEEAKVYVNTNFPPDIGGTLKTYLRACYQEAATAEATRSMIVEAEKEKIIKELEENWTCQKSVNKIQQLTAEHDAHKEEIAGLKIMVLQILEENYQAQIAGFYNDDKTSEEKKARNSVIEEYQDLIGIFKHKFLNQFNNTENKKQ